MIGSNFYLHFPKSGYPDRVLSPSDFDYGINEDFKSECVLYCTYENFEIASKSIDEKDKEIERLNKIIERGEGIRNNWESNEYQEATHYNWLDDKNHELEHENMNLQLELDGLNETLNHIRNLTTKK
jgi:hypothetical protein